MTTFKNFAIAAIVTVFGVTATYANNNKYNNHTVKVEVTAHRGPANTKNISIHEYNAAKHCNCKTCREIVKKFEKQMKHNKHIAKCDCPNCRKPTAVVPHNPVNNVPRGAIVNSRR